MIEKTWAWPAAESIHFIGLSLLIGTVGLFDLRLLGFARSVPLAALHRLVPWGVLGYAMNVMTGMMFLAGAPDQYMYNPAFQMKMLFMSLAGINVLVFYAAVFRKVRAAGYGGNAPATARIIGAASLLLWIGVMTCGRLLTFFRPPFHWCPWC
jgi:uncharacterized membrane protein